MFDYRSDWFEVMACHRSVMVIKRDISKHTDVIYIRDEEGLTSINPTFVN